MKAFNKLDGLVCPLDRANVDTDAIIPKQFLKSIKRSGFGPNSVLVIPLTDTEPVVMKPRSSMAAAAAAPISATPASAKVR